jgi:hypothetical protein
MGKLRRGSLLNIVAVAAGVWFRTKSKARAEVAMQGTE